MPYLEVCNHYINQSQIVGIGPLKARHTISGVYTTSAIIYFFFLHLKTLSILIESDMLASAEEEQMKEFASQYNQAREYILLQLDDNI